MSGEPIDEVALENGPVWFRNRVDGDAKRVAEFALFGCLARSGLPPRRLEPLGVDSSARPAAQLVDAVRQQAEQPRKQRPRRGPLVPVLDRVQDVFCGATRSNT